MAASPKDRVHIAIGEGADALVRFAAEELSGYLERLFRVPAAIVDWRPDGERPCFLVGLVTDPHVRKACSSLPDLSDQGLLVRRVDSHTMVLAGGSGTATAWAVYELVERYAVRYLLHGDVYPEDPGPFHLPELDLDGARAAGMHGVLLRRSTRIPATDFRPVDEGGNGITVTDLSGFASLLGS